MVTDKDIDCRIGQYMRGQRQERGMALSQAEAKGRQNGRKVFASTISELERGMRPWTIRRFREFAAMFGITTAELMRVVADLVDTTLRG